MAESRKISLSNLISAFTLLIAILGSAFWFYGEFTRHGTEIEHTKHDVTEIKSDVKDMSQEMRAFRGEWKGKLDEP